MNAILKQLFDMFEEKIIEEDKLNSEKDDPKGKYNFYIPKVRDYLFVYLDEQITSRGYSDEDKVRLYFERTFNRETLIEATVYFVENSKTRGVSGSEKEKRASSIRDFLIAYNHFYDTVLKYEYTQMSFQGDDYLFSDIRSKLEDNGYVILETEQYPAIQKAEYEFICLFYKEKKLQNKQRQVWIIMRLSLLFGLSLSTLKNLKVNNVDIEKRILKVLNKSKDHLLFLELPYLLLCDIKAHIEESDIQKDDYLFFTKSSHKKPITSSFLTEDFCMIKDEYLEQPDHDKYIGNRFTHYGLIKYAIAEMIKNNVNIYTIVDLTGRDVNFILSCRPEDIISSEKESNYMNSKMRSIETYMSFNY